MRKRIPKSFIDELGVRTDLFALISSKIRFVKKSGSNHFACCPFHDEKTPSFSVNRAKGFYHCFGCGASGDGIRFLMDHDNLSFVEAIEALASFNGMTVPFEESTATYSIEQKNHFQLGLQCLADAAAFFEHTLQTAEGASARQYLHNRHLNQQIISQFKIGYAPNNHALLHHLGSKYTHQLLQDVGLIGEKNGRHYDWFRGRIMFPIWNMKGEIIAFGARALGDEQPKYLNSPESHWFNKRFEFYGGFQAIKGKMRARTMIVTEGYMDVVALNQFGFDYAVAALGTAIGDTHISQLQKRAETVFFAFDGDGAGQKAAQKALQSIFSHFGQGRTQNWRFVFMPKNEDPDSLLQRHGAPAFQALLDNALPISDFLLHLINEDLGESRQAEAQMRRIQRAQEWLNKLIDIDFRECLREQVQQHFSLPRLTLSSAPPSPAHSSPAPTEKSPIASPSPAQPIHIKVLRLLGFLYLHPHFALPLRRWEFREDATFSPFWQLVYLLQNGGADLVVAEHFLRSRGWLEKAQNLVSASSLLSQEAQNEEFQALLKRMKKYS